MNLEIKNKIDIVLVSFLSMVISGCIASKKDRIIKRNLNLITQDTAVLTATKFNTMSYLEINLYSTNTFLIESKGMFIKDYYAGTWIINGDTAILKYFAGHKFSDISEVILDKAKVTLLNQSGISTTYLEITHLNNQYEPFNNSILTK